jgi:acetyltransferase-like isoleucine patch superfamily enzyme
MRKIGLAAILVFLSLATLSVVLGVATTVGLLGSAPLGDFRGVVLLLAGVFFIYLYAILLYRIFLRAMPLTEGELEEGSRGEFVAHVHSLFYLMMFNTLIRTHVMPAPLVRLIYQALGTRFGQNSFCVGVMLDPALSFIGDNSIIGHDAVLFSHAIEGKHYSMGAIHIGNKVTIGAKAIVMSDVTIEDGALVSAGAVVSKGTYIKAGEIWGGVPAKLVGNSTLSADAGA